ncbi:unnamed protein product [Plasmodium vivax]|uniref:Palmitoyltransferase n=1 Tax=Plasmodium vivax TaxID=5855 RepID=A0A564ZUY3_PLAVI|nr:unnamed protein product [Plasmodium vivax]VUZ94958.1 palmitoyltransferase DHHC6, putative [Plasmodium vivax]
MKNPLPCVVICIKLAVLATLTHLVHTGKLPIDGRSSFFFLYAASFLLYAISSLRDPGYLKSCPLAYLPKNERAAFQASLSDRTGGHTKRRDIPTACSITQDEIPSSDSFSSETVSTNDELNSFTIIHHRSHNTVITERGVRKRQKGATGGLDGRKRCGHGNPCSQPDEGRLPSTNQTEDACLEGNRGGAKFEEKANPQAGRRVPPRWGTPRLMAPHGISANVNESGPSKYKPKSLKQLHHVGCNADEKHEGPTHVKRTIGDPLERTPIICSLHVERKPTTIFRVRGGEVYQYGAPLDYCYVCGVVQILRSRHCNACHRCVRTFDHHCPWINNCVAENNRGSYLMYLLFEGMAVFHTLRLLSRVLWGMLFGENGWFFAWLVVLFLVLFFFFTMISCLALYHAYLCLINETTRENTLRARGTPEVKAPGRNPAGPFFLGYQQNVLIYFANLPVACIFPRVVRQYVSSRFCRTRGVAWGAHGEILWRPRPKSSFRSQAILLPILEHITACVRRQLSPVTLSIE